eukprot:2877698-Rhodomonas_salina.1
MRGADVAYGPTTHVTSAAYTVPRSPVAVLTPGHGAILGMVMYQPTDPRPYPHLYQPAYSRVCLARPMMKQKSGSIVFCSSGP